MRQRLFLVAGWLAAAIGAGIVASGAVAIAGGQVLDRPLRPLTAAEVAALPVPTVGSPEILEPQASGGTVAITGGPTVGSGDEEPPFTTTDTTPRWDRFTNPASSDSSVVILHAGKASFAVADNRIHILWTTPASGYVMSRIVEDDATVTISFSSSRDVWLVVASIVDGELVVVSSQAPIA